MPITLYHVSFNLMSHYIRNLFREYQTTQLMRKIQKRREYVSHWGQPPLTIEAKRKVMLQQWTELIQEQKGSGMKVNAWCKERSIGEGQFYYWQKQVCQTLLDSVSPDGSSATLVKVDVNSVPDEAQQRVLLPVSHETEPTTPQNVFRLQFKGSVLEIPAGSRAEDISEILRAVSLLC